MEVAVILAAEEGTISGEPPDVLEWACLGAPEPGAVNAGAGVTLMGATLMVVTGTVVTGMDATGTVAIGTAIGIIITATIM
jgi:hypothetical protein